MELIIGGNRMQEVAGVTAEYPYMLNRADSHEILVPWHWHEEVEFSYVRQGALRVILAGRRYEFQAGEGCFINANVLHSMEPVDPAQGASWDSHMVHPMLLGYHCKSIFDTKYMAPVLNNKRFELAVFRGENENQKEILKLLRRTAEIQNLEFSEFLTRNLFSEIWLLLLKEMQDLENNAKLIKSLSQERIQIMLEYIHQHYQEKLTLEEIAAAAIISKRECLRCFQACIQKTPVAYLLDYRLQMAEKLLRTTNLSVTEIAMETGFANSAYFAKAFKKMWDMTPRQCRKNRGAHD